MQSEDHLKQLHRMPSGLDQQFIDRMVRKVSS